MFTLGTNLNTSEIFCQIKMRRWYNECALNETQKEIKNKHVRVCET